MHAPPAGKATATTATSTQYPISLSLNRKGVSWDARAGQFTCRVGYRFSERGARVRDFQYLTADSDEATLRHITLMKRWGADCDRWPTRVNVIRLGLPDYLKAADLSKPVLGQGGVADGGAGGHASSTPGMGTGARGRRRPSTQSAPSPPPSLRPS